jgi:hypothetical protein
VVRLQNDNKINPTLGKQITRVEIDQTPPSFHLLLNTIKHLTIRTPLHKKSCGWCLVIIEFPGLPLLIEFVGEFSLLDNFRDVQVPEAVKVVCDEFCEGGFAGAGGPGDEDVGRARHRCG